MVYNSYISLVSNITQDAGDLQTLKFSQNAVNHYLTMSVDRILSDLRQFCFNPTFPPASFVTHGPKERDMYIQ